MQTITTPAVKTAAQQLLFFATAINQSPFEGTEYATIVAELLDIVLPVMPEGVVDFAKPVLATHVLDLQAAVRMAGEHCNERIEEFGARQDPSSGTWDHTGLFEINKDAEMEHAADVWLETIAKAMLLDCKLVAEIRKA